MPNERSEFQFREVVDQLVKHLVAEVEALKTNGKWVNQPESFVLQLQDGSNTYKYLIHINLSAEDGNLKIAKFNGSF
jgi:hypothetical protein